MTFSKLGTDGQLIEQLDQQTGKKKIVFTPTLDATGKEVSINLPQASRREGLYIIGATGTGKSTLLENLILQDIDQGIGVCVLDPHGDLVNAVISRMRKRLDDVVLIDLGSRDYVAGLNLFHCEHPEDPFEAENVVQAVMHILEKVYQISRDTPLMNQYFINITRTLIYNPQATVLDIPRLLTDAVFRGSLLANVPDDDVQWFWTELYEQHRRGKRLDEIISAVTNKLVEFNSRVLKPWFGQNTQTLNMRQVMDERKILLVKLKARWQSMNSLIGSILIAQILDAAYSRENIRQHKRKQFNIYADEFQTFASQDFAQLFTEARKYGIGITISHQVFEQLDDTIKATIKQAANIVVFRVSSDNAKEIAGEFDTTPPPGEMIYERVMQQVVYSNPTEQWDSQEAKNEYDHLHDDLIEVGTNLEKCYIYSLSWGTQVHQIEGTVAYHQGIKNNNKDAMKVTTRPALAQWGYTGIHLTREDWEYLDRFIPKGAGMGYGGTVDESMSGFCWEFTKLLCLRSPMPIPTMDYNIQQYIRTCVQQMKSLEDKREQIKQEHCKYEQKRTLVGYQTVKISEMEFQIHDGKLQHNQVDNDLYRMREGSPPYGSDEVERRTANEIKQLPRYTAKVRMESGEHTITTEKPSGYSNEQELRQRIYAIYEQNKDVYVRLRSEVEAELGQRRQAHQPALASPQISQQQLPRRVARQVPVKGNCPNCGFSNNSPGARFCMQCGAML